MHEELLRATVAFRQFYAAHIPGGTGGRILDVGCGFGKILWGARKCDFENITGVDISEDQIAFACNVLGLPAEQGDALAKMSSLRGELDAVLLIDVLEHCELEYSIELLDRAREALATGGKVVVQVPNGLSPFCPTFHGDVTHMRAYSPSSLAQSFRFAGFKSSHFWEMPPAVHGVASAARKALWKGFLSPLIGGYLVVACGNPMGWIYTPNLLGVAGKEGG